MGRLRASDLYEIVATGETGSLQLVRIRCANLGSVPAHHVCIARVDLETQRQAPTPMPLCSLVCVNTADVCRPHQRCTQAYTAADMLHMAPPLRPSGQRFLAP